MEKRKEGVLETKLLDNDYFLKEIKEALSSSERNRSLRAEEINKMRFIGYISNGSLLGFAATKKWEFGISEIRSLYVYPEYRKEGVGTNLISWITENHNKIFVGFTSTENKGCARAFLKNGYTKLNLGTMLMFIGRRDGRDSLRRKVFSKTII